MDEERLKRIEADAAEGDDWPNWMKKKLVGTDVPELVAVALLGSPRLQPEAHAFEGVWAVTQRIEAVRAIRMNYTRRGTWKWLTARHKRHGCRGWQRVFRDPQNVIQEQHALAEGVFA